MLISEFSPSRRMSIRRATAALCAIALAATLLASCGGGGVVPDTGVSRRMLPADFSARKAVAYSPFRTAARDVATVTDAQVLEDLNLLARGGLTLIRLFDSSDAVAARVLRLITANSLDIKVILGIWIATDVAAGTRDANLAANDAEIARGIALAKQYPGTVAAVSVGNETQVYWSFNPVTSSRLAGYLKQVRDAIAQPVTTDDNWEFFAKTSNQSNYSDRDPKPVLDAIDFVAMHTYALADTVYSPTKWDWKQESVPEATRAVAMMDAALAATRSDHAAVRTNLDGHGYPGMKIVIGETGWKAVASNGETQRAHPVNQKMFFDRLASWKLEAGAPTGIVWFEAFDEPWKGGDDKWGLFNAARQARCVAQGMNTGAPAEAGSCAPGDAAYYKANNAGPAVTANLYTVLADALTAGEARPVPSLLSIGWGGSTGDTAFTGVGVNALATAAVEVPNSTLMEITPNPAAGPNYWGAALTVPAAGSANLSAFSGGILSFWIRTTYPGAIEVGYQTGFQGDRTLNESYKTIDLTANGYNDGNWHQISIPMSSIPAASADWCCSGSTRDLSRVTSPFVIANRFGVTGNATSSTAKIYIDGVYWSR